MEILLYFLVGAFVVWLIGKFFKVSFYLLGIIFLIAIGSAVVNAEPNISDEEMQEALTVALSKHRCGKVTKNMFMGTDAEGMIYYSAKCKNNQKYIVQINAFSKNISTRVLECDIAKMLGIKCFRRLDS